METTAPTNGQHSGNGVPVSTTGAVPAPASLHAEVERCGRQIAALTEQLQETNQKIDGLREELAEIKSKTLLWRWQRFTSHRLTATAHYPPHPLKIPEHYRRLPELVEPPTIAIVTPSYNQGRFLERTLRSVLEQNYPCLKYAVQDGGSSDESIEVLRRHERQFAHWASHPDRGQAHAVNLGFQHVHGEIMAYLNSDDLLLPGALHCVADYFQRHPRVDVVYGHRILIDEDDHEVGRWILPRHDDAALRWLDTVPQETLFWRRRIWDKIGAGLDESFQFALDWDMLLRFQAAGARFARLPRFLGAFRLHQSQKTSTLMTRGEAETKLLRERSQARPVLLSEIEPAIRPYLRRQVLLRHLYRFGLVRY
jgi:GT2 family glycosyltransferase